MDKRHLPVHQDPQRGFVVSGDEIKAYSSGKMCGNCGYFEPGHAVVQMTRTRFLEKLVQELEWKPEHLGAAIQSEGGLCGAGDGDTLTATFTVGCDQWREDRGRIKRTAKDGELDDLHAQRRTMQQLHKERMRKQHRAHLERTSRR